MNNLNLIKISDRIINISSVTYAAFTPEGAIDLTETREVHHMENRCDVYLSDGSELYFYGADAIQAWTYLSVASTNISPSKREVTA